MAQPQPEERVTIDQVLRLVDRLSAEDQTRLRESFLEDQEDICIAEERLKHPGKRWSHEEIKREVGLAD